MKRRIARVIVSQLLLVETVQQGWSTAGRVITCDKGLPEGAEYVGSTIDPTRLDVYLFFTHPSFPEVNEGAEVPALEVAYTQKYGASSASEKV